MHSLWLPGGMEVKAYTNVIQLRRRHILSRWLPCSVLSLHDGSPLADSSPSHCACSDTNGLRHKAQHQHQHIWLVLTYNVGLFNVIFNNVVNGLNVNIQ